MTFVQEIAGDLWTFHAQGEWIAIPTNGIVNRYGNAVMGAGLAKDAATRYPDLPRLLGQELRRSGNRPYAFLNPRVLTVPTKHSWQQPSDLQLIIDSMKAVVQMIEQHDMNRVYLPRLGCGLGQLSWLDVRPAIAPYVTPRCLFVTSR
jgi:hypothetical protein